MNLQRVSTDGVASFSRVESPSWQTIYTDGQANDTVMAFLSQTLSNTIYSYETQRQTYQGPHTTGTLLQTVNTGYNGSAASSPCVAGTLSLPISQVEVSTTWPYTSSGSATNIQSQVCSNYDTTNAGRLTQTTQYAYGPAGSLGTAIKRQTIYSYASLGNGIYTDPSEIKVTDGTNTFADTQYQYDQGSVVTTTSTPQHVGISGSRGNPTTISQLTSGSTYLTTTQTFFDTGNIQTITDPNTSQTTQVYGSGSCGNSFPTSTTLPLSLSRSYTWNCNGGVQLTQTDESGNTWTTSYADANFWRPTGTTDPTNAITSITYPSSETTIESALPFNGTTSTSDTRLTLDSYGRTQVSQVKQSPSGSNYDSIQIYYDATGRPKTSTIPYVGAASQTGVTSTGTTTAYDTLGRPLSVTDANGGTTTYSYQANDVLVTIGPAPSGETTKQRQLQYDPLGHLISVCELSSSGGSGACGQYIAQNGFLTVYTVDPLGNITQAVQGSNTSTPETRTYQYDALSRLTSETNPESGTTTYLYDSTSHCAAASAGDLIWKQDAVGNLTCYNYDALHRVTISSYGGPYQPVTPNRFFTYDLATVNGSAMNNGGGRMVEAYTTTTGLATGTKLTDLGFSYTKRGEVSDTYESTPHSGGYYHVSASRSIITVSIYAPRVERDLTVWLTLPGNIGFGKRFQLRSFAACIVQKAPENRHLSSAMNMNCSCATSSS